MSVSLQKGGNVNLTSLSKDAGGTLASVVVGLGWDPRTTDGAAYDLDASVFVTNGSGKVLDESWFIFYGRKDSPDGSVHHHGDNLTGEGDGDDEQITIHLDKLPAAAEKVVVAVTIYEATERGQNFGGIANSYMRVVDGGVQSELAKFDLGEDFSLETAVIFGELYRKDGEWKFKAIGQGYNNGLQGLCADHGVAVG